MNYDYLFIFAHPDDAFLGAGGTIKMSASKGKTLIVSLTNGAKDDKYKGQLRAKEMCRAAAIVNADCKILDYTDGEIFLEELRVEPIRNLLLETNPKFIFTHSNNDAHIDHRSTNKIVTSCIHYIWHYCTNPNLQHVLYSMPIKLNFQTLCNCKATVMNDISTTIEHKIESIRCHESQKSYMEDNLKRAIALNRLFGTFRNCEYVEGFQLDETDYTGNNVVDWTLLSK